MLRNCKETAAFLRLPEFIEKDITKNLPDLMTKGLGSSPFSKGLADSKGMSLDVLRTSSRTIAMGEISYAKRARQGVNCQNSPADYFGKRGFAGIFRRKTHAGRMRARKN